MATVETTPFPRRQEGTSLSMSQMGLTQAMRSYSWTASDNRLVIPG